MLLMVNYKKVKLTRVKHSCLHQKSNLIKVNLTTNKYSVCPEIKQAQQIFICSPLAFDSRTIQMLQRQFLANFNYALTCIIYLIRKIKITKIEPKNFSL